MFEKDRRKLSYSLRQTRASGGALVIKGCISWHSSLKVTWGSVKRLFVVASFWFSTKLSVMHQRLATLSCRGFRISMTPREDIAPLKRVGKLEPRKSSECQELSRGRILRKKPRPAPHRELWRSSVTLDKNLTSVECYQYCKLPNGYEKTLLKVLRLISTWQTGKFKNSPYSRVLE